MKILIILTLLISTSFCEAQEKSFLIIFYVDKNDNRITSKDSAEYIRTIASTKNKNGTYEVFESYLNNSVKLKGNSLTSYFNPKYDGEVVSFYSNGNKASEEIYNDGILKSGDYYYQNGTLLKSIKYNINKVEQVKALQDAMGNSLLDKKQTGSFKTVEYNGEEIEGSYTKGNRDGSWKTFNPVNNETYFDEYKSGKYVKGKTVFADGKEIIYEELESAPKFIETQNNFWYFLKSKLNFANGQRSVGDDWEVRFSYIIEADGSLNNPIIIKRSGRNHDEEILKAIKLSPRWIPAFKRGVAYATAQQFSIGQYSKTETRTVITTRSTGSRSPN